VPRGRQRHPVELQRSGNRRAGDLARRSVQLARRDAAHRVTHHGHGELRRHDAARRTELAATHVVRPRAGGITCLQRASVTADAAATVRAALPDLRPAPDGCRPVTLLRADALLQRGQLRMPRLGRADRLQRLPRPGARLRAVREAPCRPARPARPSATRHRRTAETYYYLVLAQSRKQPTTRLNPTIAAPRRRCAGSARCRPRPD